LSVLAIIQCRLGSTRFPQKAMAELAGRPMITHVVERVRQMRGVAEYVLAVPHGQVVALGFCGHVQGPDVPENDVLARFVAVASRVPEHDTIMRVTGDCPLWNPREGERVLALYQSIHGCEYAWNVAPGYCDGEDVEVFSRAALLQAHWHAGGEEGDREHVTPWIRRHYPIATAMPLSDRRGLKTSVDTPEDLERVRQMVEATA
jgi:spore coat polysaccharide biosynthesis protein SpsF (cytidylyltransferase family)